MIRDVLTVGSIMRIPLLYRGEYSQWVERFMNYLEEQTDGEAMINSIKNGDQPLPRVTQVSIAGTTSTEQLPFNKTAKDLWDALARHMLGSEYGKQDRKAAVLYEYETFKATEGELLLDTYIRYLQVINDLKKCDYSKDNFKMSRDVLTVGSTIRIPLLYRGEYSQWVESNKTAKDLWNALARHMLGLEYGEQDRKAAVRSSMDGIKKISPVSKMPFSKKPRDSMHVRSKSNMIKSLPRTICLWIINSGCSKHMTGNRALLTNFVEKFLGTVRFGNNDFAVIAGYGDVVIGSMTIKKVYYVEGLGYKLFSVGQFCDKGLEVAFRKFTCFVRNEDGVDLVTGDRSSNLYTIALNEVASNSSTCLLAKASSSQSWLWHQCLSHLNFTTINNLVKNNLVQGLSKMNFEKDHLCSACKQGKIHQKHHKSKTAFASNKPL
nr:integrase, catalytic region, zinc finger, CCHC-type, peptidase aspartic, catalytic [Tanacetum cinerariifolium]